MKRWLHNLNVAGRRAVLSVILLVPEGWRAALRRNPLLVRVYEVFDRAKYEETFDADGWDQRDTCERPTGLPWTDYTYREPELTDDLAADIAAMPVRRVSILMPVYNVEPRWLQSAIDSVKNQWYPHWQLCIADDCSTREDTVALLRSLDDPQIVVTRLDENRNISGASNEALKSADGEFIALLDHDDELTPDALFRVMQAINEQGFDFVFSDEDKIDEAGHPCEPHYKSSFSPELFLSQNYLCHLAVIRAELVRAVGGFTPGTDGAQDYDLFLKVLERTTKIGHIPRVLYHWRKVPGSTAAEFSDKSYAQQAGVRSLEASVARRGWDATVENGPYPGTYRVQRRVQGSPLVSIVIPFKDKPELLDLCLGSIREQSTYTKLDIVGISNNSTEPETFEAMERWSRADDRIRFFEHDIPFNFSALNNFAVQNAVRGDYVLMLNNDIEIISPAWVEALLEYAQDPEVGVVGGKLYYPDRTLQHAGVIVGLGGVAGHSHKHLGAEDPGYKYRPHLPQSVSAVTAACCLVRRAVYEEVGGLDETQFRIAFNDVDFCLRVMALGLRNVYTPYCEAWHHESVSRGYEDTWEKKARFDREIMAFRERHADFLGAGDPYYNPNLTLSQENFFLSRDENAFTREAR
ncbi:MAG: glycosyltransferase family 2 protein [Xanthomonadales bacterium]|jgi:GT2 family glycosyltransferase|nr:glycosyltransferase family 2 protein [Xanthomonadales bacterium]